MQLLKSGSSGNDAEMEEAWNRIGDHYAERHNWEEAVRKINFRRNRGERYVFNCLPRSSTTKRPRTPRCWCSATTPWRTTPAWRACWTLCSRTTLCWTAWAQCSPLWAWAGRRWTPSSSTAASHPPSTPASASTSGTTQWSWPPSTTSPRRSHRSSQSTRSTYSTKIRQFR